VPSLQISFSHQSRHRHSDDESDDCQHKPVDDVGGRLRHGRHSRRRQAAWNATDDRQHVALVQATEIRRHGCQHHQQQLGWYLNLQLPPESHVDVLLRVKYDTASHYKI